MTKFDKLLSLMDAWNDAGRGSWTPRYERMLAYFKECLPDGKDHYHAYFGLSNPGELQLYICFSDYLGRGRMVDALVTRSEVRVEPGYFTGKVNRRFVKTLETLYDQV